MLGTHRVRLRVTAAREGHEQDVAQRRLVDQRDAHFVQIGRGRLAPQRP
jgi:hypothetical protein